MSEANFQVALREAERAAKKQKICAGQCATAVGALQQHLQAVRQQVRACAFVHTVLLHLWWLRSQFRQVSLCQASAAGLQTCTENCHPFGKQMHTSTLSLLLSVWYCKVATHWKCSSSQHNRNLVPCTSPWACAQNVIRSLCTSALRL